MTQQLSHAHWLVLHEKTLASFKAKELIVSYSGGKDSSLLLDYLLRSQKDFGYTLHAHGVAFPCHVFLPREQARLDRYWQERGLPIVWHGPGPRNDEELARMVEAGKSPCVVCSQAKKDQLLGHFQAREIPWENLVVVIGYTLWDLASATVEHMLRTCFGPEGDGTFQGRDPGDRFLEISQRFYPVLRMANGLSVFKPLIRYNDPDIAAIVAAKGIPITKQACRFKSLRPKRQLSRYYRLFGLKFTYDDVYAFARKAFDIPDIDYFQQMDLTRYVTRII